MVNERQGKEYEVIPVYNRKLARTVLKRRIEKTQGYGKVNKKMGEAFKKYQMKMNGSEE